MMMMIVLDNHYNEFYDDYYDSEGDLVENSFDDDSDDIGNNQSKIIFELTSFELSRHSSTIF